MITKPKLSGKPGQAPSDSTAMIQAMTTTAVLGPREVETATVRVFAPWYVGTGAA